MPPLRRKLLIPLGKFHLFLSILLDLDKLSEFLVMGEAFQIHENPVRAGWVESPEEYLYSSARNYSGLPGLIEIDYS
jgi:hypothetical protein